LKKNIFENFNISENNIINVELAKALRYQSKCPHTPMHGLGLIDNHVEKLPPFASIHHSIHGRWRQVDEAP
jgi:hypothetical protein